MKLSDLLSRRQVFTMLGMNKYDLRVLHEDGKLVGIPVGSEPEGPRSAYAYVYTKRQVNAYKKGKGGDPTDEEIAQIMDGEAVAELIGTSVKIVAKHAENKALPSRTVGGVRLFLRKDVEAFAERREAILAEMDAPRVDVVGGCVGDFDVATAVTAYRQSHNLSQQGLADLVDGGLSQLRQIISKIERRQTVRVREDVYGRLVAVVQEN